MAASKFTVEVRAALIERFAAGCSVADAARDGGVREKTLKTWLTRGRRGDSPAHVEFVERVDKARADSERRVSGAMDRAELLCVASRSARAGSVAAMKLVWDMVGKQPAQANDGKSEFDSDSIKAMDELARRRSACAAPVRTDDPTKPALAGARAPQGYELHTGGDGLHEQAQEGPPLEDRR